MNKPNIVLLVTALCLSLLVTATEAYPGNPTITAYVSSTPAVDGIFGIVEWVDASSVQFNNTVVCIKHTSENLYVAFEVDDDTYSGDTDKVGICIDVLNDGGNSSALGADDIVFEISRNGTMREADGAPASGWSAATLSYDVWWTAECSIPYAKISVEPGVSETLGILFCSLDAPEWPHMLYWYYWPHTHYPIPANWGNVAIVNESIPEYSSVLAPILLLMLLTTLVVYWRRKLPKHRN